MSRGLKPLKSKSDGFDWSSSLVISSIIGSGPLFWAWLLISILIFVYFEISFLELAKVYKSKICCETSRIKRTIRSGWIIITRLSHGYLQCLPSEIKNIGPKAVYQTSLQTECLHPLIKRKPNRHSRQRWCVRDTRHKEQFDNCVCVYRKLIFVYLFCE